MSFAVASPATAAWLGSWTGVRLLGAVLLVLAGVGCFVGYESLILDWPVAREEPALFDAYHLGRSLFAVFASGLLVAAMVGTAHSDCALRRDDMDGRALGVAIVLMASALGFVALLAVSPAAFHRAIREDGLVEWASALLLLSASLAFARAALRVAADRQAMRSIAAGLLAVAFFVIGMEEISWMQRVFGFGTPAELAAINWQGEFNLHNIQTDLSEFVYYAGAGLFLILLPLLRDVAPRAMLAHSLAAFVPGRAVAAISLPLAVLTYGQWNLLPVQMTSLLALSVSLAFAGAARRRDRRGEALCFVLLALGGAVVQAIMLVLGPTMADLPDASEYKELFIAIGFAAYAWTATRALAAETAQ